MFSRRQGERFNRGRISVAVSASAPAPPVTPLTILGSLAWWVRADMGITIGTGVSAWADQSGNGVNFTQATGGAQPAFVASALDGRPAVRGDGVDDVLAATWARVAPSVQPLYLWLIAKQIAWLSGKTLIGDYTTPNGLIIDQIAPSPNFRQFNGAGVNANSGAPIGSYARVEVQFTGSVNDYVKAGAAAASTGASAGNTAGGGVFQLFRGGPNAGSGSSAEIAEAFCFLGTPTAPQRASLDAYCASLYPSAAI